MNIVVAIIMLLAGLFGAWYHWCEVHKRGDSESFYHYFFCVNTTASQSAVAAFVMAMQTLYLAGTFDMVRIDATIEALLNGQVYAPMAGALATAFTAGYAADSKFNSSQVSLRPDSATTSTGAN